MKQIEIKNHGLLTDFYLKNGLEADEEWYKTMSPIKSIAVFNGEQLIAAATLSRRFDKNILDYIAVDEAFRRTGIGKTLLAEILKDTDEVFLTARNPAFFKALGFSFTDELPEILNDCVGCSQYKNGCMPRNMKRG